METVLKLSELCRKFETEQEKILPFLIPNQVSNWLLVCSYTPKCILRSMQLCCQEQEKMLLFLAPNQVRARARRTLP